jgi:hypothetical protein
MVDKDKSYIDSIDADVGIQAAMERAHKSGERAAEQFVKLLGTLHGGLGLAIAAWLQRIFEQSEQAPTSSLAWYLALALGFVAVGLVTLVLTAILDQQSAGYAARSVGHNTERIIIGKNRVMIAELEPGDERSAKELACVDESAELARKIVSLDARQERLNNISVWTGVASWVCLIAAFATLGIGIIVTINRIAG